MNKEDDDEDDVEEVDESTLDARLASVDVSEDVTALVQGEELSEEFKEKASTIFEAAVKSKLRSEVLRIEEAKTQEIAEEVESVQTVDLKYRTSHLVHLYSVLRIETLIQK